MKKIISLTFGTMFTLAAFFCTSCTKADNSLQSSSDDSAVAAVAESSLATVTSKQVYNWHPGHYMLFNNDYDVVTKTTVPAGFRGIQKKYLWKDLEPTKGNHDFTSIQTDINGLDTGQYLVIQIQTKAFEIDNTVLPDYIKNFTGPGQTYEGCTYRTSTGSINPSYWDSLITLRLKALYKAMGNTFRNERKIEMVIISESALSANGNDLDWWIGIRFATRFFNKAII